MTRLPFYASCVGWPGGARMGPDLLALCYLVDHGSEITRETFRRRVRPAPPAGWNQPGLHPKEDWHVHYFRLPGLPVYWYVRSMIEYVYATDETMQAVRALAVAAAVAA